MIVQIRCDKEGCEALCWVKGYAEPDVGIDGAVDDTDPMADACEHVRDGGDYTVIDSSYDDETED